MEQKLLLEERQESLHKSQTRLSLHLLEKQLSLLKLEEFLLLVTITIGGVLGRAALQGLPSVEPITLFAVLAGSLFGKVKGASVGAASWYLSDYLVMGGQGPWTPVHIAAGAIAGYLGSMIIARSGKRRYLQAGIAMGAATLLFELMMNTASGFFFGFGIIASFLSAIPFMITHIVSNLGLSLAVPSAGKAIQAAGKLEEKALCRELIRKIKERKKSGGQMQQVAEE